MYSPDTCPAGWAALAQEGRATNAPARSNDDAARFTFIVAASVDWPKDFFEPHTYFPTPTFSIQIRIFDSLILACQNSNANRYAVSQHERPGRHLRIRDRKSTRLNSSHVSISYAVFCLKKKNNRYILTYEVMYYI